MIIESYGSESKPIFVVGMNASGTTLLADCLGQHSNIFSFVHETRVIPFIMSNFQEYGDLNHDESYLALWNDLVKIPSITIQLHGDLSIPQGWVSWPRSMAGILDGLFRYLAASENVDKKIWCEKTPMHALHMIKIAGVFPRARFIHVIRDGRDCAASFHRRWKRTPQFTIYRWRQLINSARSQSLTLGDKYIEVVFERLTSEPEDVLKGLCDWLELDYESAMLNARRREKTNPSRKTIQRNTGNWQTYFSERKIAELEYISGGMLQANGYITKYSVQDHDPAGWQQRVWLLSDYSRQLVEETRQQIAGHPYRTWPMYFRYLYDAYRQITTNKGPRM